MSKRAFDEKIAKLDAMRRASEPPPLDELESALRDRNNLLVSKAVQVVERLRLDALASKVAEAFARFFGDDKHEAKKLDPQCWAKNACAKCLIELGWSDPTLFLRGLKHIQMEPVWAGESDSAGPLRAACAKALTQCSGLRTQELLTHLVDALGDREENVRTEVVRALSVISDDAVPLLLRLRVLAGEEPAVLGACFVGILLHDRQHGLAFVRRYLQPSDSGAEAAFAIAEARREDAFHILHQAYERENDPWFRTALLKALGLTRDEQAFEYLFSIAERDGRDRKPAREALEDAHLSEELQQRLRRITA